MILAPVHVEDNYVGGITFLGPQPVDRLGTMGLALLARTLLTGVRLLEEQQRESEITQVEMLSQARAEFVQRMAHSIHSPLDSLQSTVADAITGLSVVRESVERLRESAGELIMAFAKEDAEDLLVVKPFPVAIKEFIDTLIFMHSRAYSEAGLQLESGDVPEDWTAKLDKRAFMEVMDTLLGNALKYAREKVTVRVERNTDSGVFLFYVTDDGPGVDPAIVDRLFQPGVRDPGTSKTGHGYGLYFARLLMNKRNGAIRLNKDSPKGAEFVIEVPAA